MTSFVRRLFTLSVCGLALSGIGCSFFPEALKPSELWKLNRGPGPSEDPFFSVQDDVRPAVGSKVDPQ